jgi:hypothetical protein
MLKALAAARRNSPSCDWEPKRQIQIATFVPDLDALPAELAKSRNFLPEPLGDGADYGDRLHFGEIRPRIAHHVRGDAKFALAGELIAVLLCDLSPPHGLPRLRHENALGDPAAPDVAPRQERN